MTDNKKIEIQNPARNLHLYPPCRFGVSPERAEVKLSPSNLFYKSFILCRSLSMTVSSSRQTMKPSSQRQDESNMLNEQSTVTHRALRTARLKGQTACSQCIAVNVFQWCRFYGKRWGLWYFRRTNSFFNSNKLMTLYYAKSTR
jgi:hypothetical protein